MFATAELALSATIIEHSWDDLCVVVELQFIERVFHFLIFILWPSLLKEVSILCVENILRSLLCFCKLLFDLIRYINYGPEHAEDALFELPHAHPLGTEEESGLCDILLSTEHHIAASNLCLQALN